MPATHVRLCWGNRFAGSRDVAWHTHAETEIVAVTQGRCRIQAGEANLEGRRGSVFFLPSCVPQYQETFGSVRTTYIGFELPPGLVPDEPRVIAFPASDSALAWIEQLCDSQRAKPPFSEETSGALLLALLRRLGDLDDGASGLHYAVVRAQRYLEEHLLERPTLPSTARAAGVSASHLSALFAQQCGEGPMQYLQRLRLDRACWHLANPYLRVHEVAAASGYEDENYFARLFRKRFGLAPGRWRALRDSQRKSRAPRRS